MKKTACSLLLALMSVSGITAQNLIYFDTPCSLKGRQAWWEGHPERFADGKKPISAGESPVNFVRIKNVLHEIIFISVQLYCSEDNGNFRKP